MRLLLLFLSFLLALPMYAQDKYPLSNTTHGTVGLIQIPTARVDVDGEFGFGVSTEVPFNRIYGKMQFFPWLEAAVKYTEGTHKPYNNVIDDQTWKDKGIDLKIRLFEETDTFPAIAIGFNDFGGTAYYASEYIVANKRFNNVDFTFGMGFGRLGGGMVRPGKESESAFTMTNPFSKIIDGHERRGGSTRLGGALNIGRLFSGPTASLFGGLEYYTPIPNLSLKLEYDPTDYSREEFGRTYYDKEGHPFLIDSRINAALNYRLEMGNRDNVDISLGLVRGNTFFANFSVHSSLNDIGAPLYEPYQETLSYRDYKEYSALTPEWKKYLSELIMWQLGNEGLVTHNLIFNENELIVEISQGRFRRPIYAIDLASRVLANNAPKNIDMLTVINIDQGTETLRATIERDHLFNIAQRGIITESDWSWNNPDTTGEESIFVENEYLYPNFYWNIKPNLAGTLQHQIRFFFWQIEALIHAEYSIRKGMYLTADIGIDIDNNFDEYTYHVPDGDLHHVRQDRRLYLTEGTSGIRRLAYDYLFDINRNLKAKVSAGYLEWMFGGVGGEILYIPDSKHWAVGLDAHWLKQRDFDGKLGFQKYETVQSFLSFYYDLPFYDMRFKASAGKFLGGDKGVDIDVSRRFDSGARVGAKVALTDCDADCVGEGSFNKWIYFELPMDLFYIQSTTRKKTGYSWSPLTKDAGQKAESGARLYDLAMNAPDEVDVLRKKEWSFKKIFGGLSTKPISRN